MGARAGHEIVELRREVARQREELDALRAQVDASAYDDPELSADVDRPVSRRRLLGMAGAATAGAVGATVLAASPAGAGVDGDVILGTDSQVPTTATNPTGVSSTATSHTFRAQNTATGAAIVGEATGAGAGVSGASGTGNALLGVAPLAQAGAPLRLAPHATVAGPPTSTAHTLGQLWMDSAGVLWQCAVAGSPGTWGRVALLGVGEQNVGTGKSGVQSTHSDWAFLGDNGGSGAGLAGSGDAGDGVVGTSGLGSGIVAQPPLVTAGAHLRIVPATSFAAGPPASGAHTLGQFWMDTNGVLFQCVGAGNPGTWVRQLSFVPLAAPTRVYDSRVGQANPSGSTQGTLAFGAGARTINCSPSVPAGATSILLNLAVTGTAGASAGALLVWAAGASEPVASSINWTGAGQTLANSVTSACDASQDVQVKCVASAGSSTHIILDVIGYYR